MMSPHVHKPTIDFLAAMQETCSCDEDVDKLMDNIAITFGDMFGNQSDASGVSERFIGMMREAMHAAMEARKARAGQL